MFVIFQIIVVRMQTVAVVGCGAIGLTTALAIQNTLENVDVTIFAKDLSPYTTSDISAGFWEPFLLGNTPQDKVCQWAKVTYNYLLALWREGERTLYYSKIYNFDN